MGICIREQAVQDYLLRALEKFQPDDVMSVELIRELVGDYE